MAVKNLKLKPFGGVKVVVLKPAEKPIGGNEVLIGALNDATKRLQKRKRMTDLVDQKEAVDLELSILRLDLGSGPVSVFED